MTYKIPHSNEIFLIYSISSLVAATATVANSAYTAWFLKVNFDSLDYIGFVVMSVLSGILLLWALVILAQFMIHKNLACPSIFRFVIGSWSLQIATSICALTMMINLWGMPFFVIAVIWYFLNLLVGLLCFYDSSEVIIVSKKGCANNGVDLNEPLDPPIEGALPENY